jgi:hypothetical protein
MSLGFPTSNNATVFLEFLERRFARMHPADPAPIIK